MNIVLVGFMCSGKTRIGKLLSQKLNREFIDTDALIEKKTGSSIAEIIRQKGETAFREIETKCVEEAASKESVVISTGGGVPVNPQNMSLLKKNGTLIWLKVSPAIVLKRAGNYQSRPLIDPLRPLESVTERLRQREPFYAQAAYSVDTDQENSQDVVGKIMSFLSSVKS